MNISKAVERGGQVGIAIGDAKFGADGLEFFQCRFAQLALEVLAVPLARAADRLAAEDSASGKTIIIDRALDDDIVRASPGRHRP